MAAPVTVIIAWDTEFHEKLPKLFPHADMRSYFIGNKPLIEETAFRNSSLQAAISAPLVSLLSCGENEPPPKYPAEKCPEGSVHPSPPYEFGADQYSILRRQWARLERLLFL